MCGVAQGFAARGKVPYVSTFSAFMTRMFDQIRIAAMSKLNVKFAGSHVGVSIGEDGPTHQPVEHLSALRAIPNLEVWRPADSVETLEVWQASLQSLNTPSIIALSRQNLKPVRKKFIKNNLSALGAYILVDNDDADICLYSSGSEIEIAINASEKLELEGIKTKVISVPSIDRFYLQNKEYRDKIVNSIPKIVIEAGVRQSWDYILNKDDIFIGMTGFGSSAPAKDLYEHFSITEEKVVSSAKLLLNRRKT